MLEWLDSSGTGHVDFDEYLIGMASVMSNAGIAKDAGEYFTGYPPHSVFIVDVEINHSTQGWCTGIEEAREALSMEMQRMSQLKASQKLGNGEVPKFNLENVGAAREIVGESNIEKMKVAT